MPTTFLFLVFNCMQSASQREAGCRQTHTVWHYHAVWRGACQRSQVSPPVLGTHPRSPRKHLQLHPLCRRQEAGPKPREGTTQIAIISSLAKTSNSPNYPARRKKTQNENKLTCLHRSHRSNTHRGARARSCWHVPWQG